MGKYRKKPVVIDAVQYTSNNGWQFTQNSEGKITESSVLEPTNDNPSGLYLQIETLEGIMTATPGDWIIRGVKGELYPCKPDIFEMTYEEVK